MTGKLLLFGGTTEARKLLEHGLPAIYSVVTDYGAKQADGECGAEVVTGRMDRDAIVKFIKERGVTCAIDATHPYAVEATANIKSACEITGTPLMRVLRESTPLSGDIIKVSSCAEAAELLNTMECNALLTVGSKELASFTSVNNYKERLFPRVLPSSSVIASCEALGFDAGHIIAMQGPFSESMNIDMIDMTKAEVIVTKDGGTAGGTAEKFTAAAKRGIKVILVTRHEERGHSTEEALLWARRELGLSRPPLFPLLTDIENKKAVIAGGGKIALRRAMTLQKCGAHVKIISPSFCGEIKDLGFELVEKKYESSDLDGAFLAVAATNDRNANKKLAEDAKRAGIAVSVADAAGESTFFFPSLVTEEEVSVSISAAGLSPKLVRLLADRVREVLPLWVSSEREKITDSTKELQSQ